MFEERLDSTHDDEKAHADGSRSEYMIPQRYNSKWMIANVTHLPDDSSIEELMI